MSLQRIWYSMVNDRLDKTGLSHLRQPIHMRKVIVMDAKQFSKKLTDLIALAIQNDRALNSEQIQGIFKEEQLEEDQMKLIYQYLNSQNITITDVKLELPEEQEVSADPLSMEEEEYLKEYRESLPDPDSSVRAELWKQYAEGKADLAGKLAEGYFEYIAELSCKNHRSAYHLGDMIQDLNLQLILLLNGGSIHSEDQLFQELDHSVEYLLSEYDEGNFRDNYLVQRVQKLDDALKEITDEDEENSFSVEELSVFLDMSVEEIKDVLKLTGDENEN